MHHVTRTSASNDSSTTAKRCRGDDNADAPAPRRQKMAAAARQTKSTRPQVRRAVQNTGPWQPDEIQRFDKAMRLLWPKYDIWVVQRAVGTRDYRQCRLRFDRCKAKQVVPTLRSVRHVVAASIEAACTMRQEVASIEAACTMRQEVVSIEAACEEQQELVRNERSVFACTFVRTKSKCKS